LIKLEPRQFRKAKPTLWMLLIACALGGCGTVKTLFASLPMNDGKNASERVRPALQNDQFLIDISRRFGVYALFAGAVYRDDLEEDVKDGRGCDYIESGYKDAGHLHHGMPRPNARRVDNLAGWKRWVPDPHSNEKEVVACFDEEGLYYETYVYINELGEMESAVIAFRGTENRAAQYLFDWGTNFAAFFGIEPRQYGLAKQRIPKLAAALEAQLKKDVNGRVDITAVGHSLGGGLAQQAGYISPQIHQVITFNSSPVTNWTQLRLDQQIQVAFPTIYRFYHTGEILGKFRFITTSFNTTRYARHDIGLQFAQSTSFEGHSMQIILCSMAEILSQQTPPGDGDHGLYLDFLTDGVLKNPALCPKIAP
jgi:hypothetical protein